MWWKIKSGMQSSQREAKEQKKLSRLCDLFSAKSCGEFKNW
jgi:hypothetical protein